jgi:hypothetical protein
MGVAHDSNGFEPGLEHLDLEQEDLHAGAVAREEEVGGQ